MADSWIHIPRDFARSLGEDAVRIADRGSYSLPDGSHFDIAEEVEACVRATIHLASDHAHASPMRGEFVTQIEVTNETTLSAARRHLDLGLRCCALNFASALEPGGGFLRGARAQEEYLCRSSALYLCLRNGPMYAFHQQQDDPFYSDAMSWSPDVPVFREDQHALCAPWCMTFLTAAACMAKQIAPRDQARIRSVMMTRTEKVLSLAQQQGHDSLVLGAWGCGAFGNDGDVIAGIFRDAIFGPFAGAFRKITFAIVDESADLFFLSPFRRAFAQSR